MILFQVSPPPTNSTSDPDLGAAPIGGGVGGGGGGPPPHHPRNSPYNSTDVPSSNHGTPLRTNPNVGHGAAHHADRAAQLDRSTPLLKQHNPAHHPLAAGSHPLATAATTSHPLAQTGHHPSQMGHHPQLAANHTPPAAPAAGNHVYAAAGSNHAARHQFTSPRTHIRESTKVNFFFKFMKLLYKK